MTTLHSGPATTARAPRTISSYRKRLESISAGDLLTISLLTIAPVIRLALLTGPMGSDDLNYFHYAQHIARLEHFTELHHHAGRLAFLVFVGLPAVVLGSITSGAIVNVLVLSLRDVLVVWFVRREMTAPITAIAAAVLSLNAISTTYAGVMTPDPLLSLLMFGSVTMLYLGTIGGVAESGPIVLAGVLAGMSYSAKDAGLLVAAPSLAYLFFRQQASWIHRIGSCCLYGAGLFAVAMLEALAYFVISGDALYRSHALAAVHNATIVEAPNLLEFLRATYWNLRAVTSLEAASTFVLLASAFVFPAALLTRSRFSFFSATGLFVGIYLIFGSSSFTRWMPLPVQDRYFEPLVAFLAVGAASLLEHFRARAPRAAVPIAGLAVGIMVVLSVPAVTANAGDVTFSGVGRNAAIAIRSLRAARPDVPIYVSPMLHRILEPFVAAEVFASLHTLGEPLQEGAFLIRHPWEPTSPNDLPKARTKPSTVYLVVDEDQRVLGRFALEAKPDHRAAVVEVAGPTAMH